MFRPCLPGITLFEIEFFSFSAGLEFFLRLPFCLPNLDFPAAAFRRLIFNAFPFSWRPVAGRIVF